MTPAETIPEGLLPWIREQEDIRWRDYLVYRAGRWTNPLTGIKEKCVDAVCTACGRSMKLEHVAGPDCARYSSAPFGFGWKDDTGTHESISGRETCCPECGKKVTAVHIGSIGETQRYCWPMTLEAQGEAVILYLWRVGRWADKEGRIHWDAVPWEAYGFSQGKAKKWVHWMKTMGGSVCLFQKWEERKKFTDTAYDVDIVYCPEGIEKATAGTYVENSKLAEYMAIDSEYRFPVTWLRIYQRHPHVENLMTCGAARLTAGMIAREKKAESYYSDWNEKTDLLKQLDHKKARPWEMLRIQKEELSYFTDREKKDGPERLKALIMARKAGLRIRCGEENPAWIHGYGSSYLREGIDPRKAERYMARQKRKYPKDYINDSGIFDYWENAKWLGMDLNDPQIRWPQRFKTAHDDAAQRRRTLMDEERKRMAAAEAAAREKKFAARFERMSRYSWELNGILIRPALNEQELIDEGKTLSHCVGTYARRHAAGELTIFFIRRASEPDKPWFTLNFKEETLSVTENRGAHNCARTEEVRAFEEAWLAWVRAGAKKNNTIKEVTAA